MEGRRDKQNKIERGGDRELNCIECAHAVAGGWEVMADQQN